MLVEALVKLPAIWPWAICLTAIIPDTSSISRLTIGDLGHSGFGFGSELPLLIRTRRSAI